ncbi:MAG: hypothetical protein A2X13_02225 [Bacteroidetes bacterium GWC2_33_15]|nr:MAG: hypothetical protein A2X10_07400 [Bacteroidetes bacterium GWA2_33_15]OFX52292.1 MAG: hypothetical protein A2X13_02225 [Bacteroidetes bacterium GWC2_33_15]OFX64446.1 MAG: hypothetical protein A2X15_13045 [Bacteroidetes bacterium GWB2_32_14]OFX67851.1 MAG: hypothetical protein A2X14_06870 [Bacteroidetes bacterium GWD2_33_33]HAN19469.1 hypothetical protein [Bacteroidales bacterium]
MLKQIVKYSLLIFISLYALNPIHAQMCSGFHKSKACRHNFPQAFQNYGQSRSAMLEINKTFEYKFVLYGKKDFIFIVCTESNYEPVHFRILDAETKETIYDNANENYIESIGFTNENTRSVILEITLLAERVKPEDGSETRACVGINIIWRKVPRVGF